MQIEALTTANKRQTVTNQEPATKRLMLIYTSDPLRILKKLGISVGAAHVDQVLRQSGTLEPPQGRAPLRPLGILPPAMPPVSIPNNWPGLIDSVMKGESFLVRHLHIHSMTCIRCCFPVLRGSA